MFHKILIANRGEIACRVIKSAKEMGIQTVAIYSTADADSLHVTMADEAYCVGTEKAADSYLQIANIIKIAKDCNAAAIHPGYGFLSESPAFAERCAAENIVFIGPSISAMQAMASKQLAKQLLEKTNVPLTPGYHGKEQTEHKLLAEANKIGFPILLKATDGGGGKGMRVVNDASEFSTALASAKRESMASFGSDTMLIEKLIAAPRHVEVQILADSHGKVLHLFERDCSIQRRHQKIIEEAPASAIDKTFREKITSAAVEVAKAIDYQGAGTVEFLSDGENFYFMEMNTRLQVEHPVTEMITGLDLVAWQIRIAANQHLNLEQDDININGHAIECRIYAEDPENNFMPSIGKISFLQQKTDAHSRIDTGIRAESEVSRYYDPMLAKIIAWGQDREQARARLADTLDNYHLLGVKNNVNFLKSIIKNQAFINNKISTNFLNEEKVTFPKLDLIQGGLLAACLDYLDSQSASDPLLHDVFAYQMHLDSHWQRKYLVNGQNVKVKITPVSKSDVQLAIIDPQPDAQECSNYPVELKVSLKIDHCTQQLILNDTTSIHKFLFTKTQDKFLIFTKQGVLEIQPDKSQGQTNDHSHTDNQLTAPMPGTIVAILKKANDQIKFGEPLIVMEAMKMEHTITAPRNGTISSIFYDIGSQVQEGATLVAMDEK